MDQPDMRTALLRGARNRCPNCGQGRLLGGYLKPVSHCAICGEDFSRIRPADGPAYFVLCFTCLLLIPAQLVVSQIVGENIVAGLVFLLGMMTAISLILLRPAKGIFMAIQWVRQDFR